MNKVLIAVVVLLCLAVSAFAAPNAAQAFAAFKNANNKQYDDPVEEARRFEIFQENMLRAEKLNQESGSDSFDVSGPFADLTQEEFESMYLMDPEVVRMEINQDIPNVTWFSPSGYEIPNVTYWDWASTKPGSVTPVKNQGQCGSCWAFAATEVLESHWVIAGHAQQILAPQQLVDCTYTHTGCSGGWYGTAWTYLHGTTKGQERNVNYPYKAAYSGGCHYNAAYGVVKPTSVVYIAANEAAIYSYLTTKGPVAIAVDASHWSLYKSGTIFPASSCTGAINHAVVITGVTTVNGVAVWRVRNSWGSTWGTSGYIYLRRGVNACHLANYPESVTV